MHEGMFLGDFFTFLGEGMRRLGAPRRRESKKIFEVFALRFLLLWKKIRIRLSQSTPGFWSR